MCRTNAAWRSTRFPAAPLLAGARVSCAARSENRLRSFSRMSALAARVKVTISISSTFAPSSTSRLTRSTSTLVLPEPAAAATSRLVPRASIAPA